MYQAVKNWSLRDENQVRPMLACPRILQVKNVQAVLEGGEPTQGSAISLNRENSARKAKAAKVCRANNGEKRIAQKASEI